MARLAAVLLLAALPAQAQQPEPTTPAARHVSDQKYGFTLQIPAAWNLSRRDGELSTFHMDARSAPSTTQLRAVVSISFNPYPLSTFAGAIVTETIFSWPGIGRLTLSAISNRDYALVQGCILAVGLTYVAVNLLTDVAYTIANPRMRR